MKNIILSLSTLFLIFGFTTNHQHTAALKMGLLKYNGGGDWYSNPTALPNLATFCNKELGTNFDRDYGTVEVGNAALFDYAFLHMTGHGNVVFSDYEAENLRNYLIAGGFLHIDDNYGMDPYVRAAMKKVFPEQEFIELPFEHQTFYSYESDLGDGWEDQEVHKDTPEARRNALQMGANIIQYAFEQ